MLRTLLLLVTCLLLGLSRFAAAEELELDPQLTNPSPEASTEEIKGGMVYRFAPLKAPAENLQDHLYWRSLDGVIAAETAPVKLLIDNAPVIQPKDEIVKDRGTIKRFPVDGQKNLAEGKHVLIPGDIAITIKGSTISSTHPAIKAEENEVRILCAPVRLEAVDANGIAVPTAINLVFGKERLLRDVVKFSALTVWLPVGCKYTSSLGSFTVAPDGKVTAEQNELSKDVKLTSEGLRLTVSPPAVATPKPVPLGRILSVNVPGTEKSVTYFYNPLCKPGEATAVVFSKKQYETATKAAFNLSDFSYSYPQEPPQKFEAVTPAPELAQAAALELQTEAADLGWLKIPPPRWDTAGVLNISIEGRLINSINQPLVVADPNASVYVLPHRLRAVFTNTETETYAVLLKPKFAGGEAKVLCKSDAAEAKPLTLGTLQLPAVAENQCDSRLFTLKMSALPPGNYQLWVEAGGTASSHVALSIVPWYFRSDFLVHQMTSCMGMWPLDDEGLKLMHDCGMEMLCSGGFGSIYKAADMTHVDKDLAASLRKDANGLPAELATARCPADVVLQTMIKHQIRQLDFYPRGDNFYLEGLSYHHSYKPSVDRMIRRMQIFTQQTMDYPSLWGMNYSWFPALFGYSEGGLDTDIHKIDRNATLEKNLKEAGILPLTPDERKFFDENKFSADESKRTQALQLMDKAVAHWKGQMEFGFGKHNKLYNDAVHEVEPEAACVLYENAGHDPGTRTKSLFNDMTAITYESYSDYPEWPMSASFTTDWAKGNFPGKPVWITVDPGNSSEGMMKSMFHAFGRGAAGSGTITMSEQGPEAKRRGKGMNFLAQYGAIAAQGVPDHRFAILSTDGEQVVGTGGQWNCHAMYYYLTRLGCAPVIVNDEDVAASGIPAGTQVLFIVRQTVPLEPKVLSAIKAFTDKGGKLIVTGDTKVKFDGAILVDKAIKNLWELGGFTTHLQFWKEFEGWEKPLSEALAKAGVPPLARTDPHRGVVVTLESGPVRYVVVITDEENQSWAVVKPNAGLPVSLEGSGWLVRDLVKQQDLKTSEKDGRTDVAVDLITEPVTILALYKAAPSALAIKVQGDVKTGGELVFKAEASAGNQPAGALPIKVEICDAGGAVRGTLYRGAGEEIRWPIAALEQPGNWTIKVQEQLTGVSASAPVAIAAAKTEAALAQVSDVHVVNSDHLHHFFQRPQEKRIIVEPGQEKFLPLAKKLAEQLTAAGVKASVWETRAENYDTIPIRWYPREDEDVPRWKLVESGKLIGVRQNMQAYVDTVNRAHIPERGGYGEVNPPYMLGNDCILFSGGRLAESLRVQTPWMETPTVPGKGQGRVVVCFSPFTAGYAVLALVANDEQGTAKAAAELLNYVKPAAAAATPAPGEWKALTATPGTAAVAQPFTIYSPVRHIRNLWATRDGKAAVALDSKKDTLALVDAGGKITASVAPEMGDVNHMTFDESGQVWLRTARHTEGEWYYQELFLNCFAPDGTQTKKMLVYNGSIYFTDLPTDYEGGFKVAPNGTTMLLGKRGGFELGDASSGKWNRFADEPFVPVRDAIREPRFPVGAVFSPDSKYVLLTMDTRPVGWGSMNWPAEHPSACATFLFDVATGKPLWQLRDNEIRKTTYAVHTNFGAVSNDGNRTAFADYRGSVYVVDKTGKILVQELVNAKPPAERYHLGPQDGVGVAMSDAGNLVLAGYKNLLVLINGTQVQRVKRPGVTAVAVTHDGSLAFAAYESGDVEAFDPSGASKWTFSAKGVSPFLAPVNDNGLLVASSEGDLMLLDAAGKETRRTHLLETTEVAKHEPKAVVQNPPAPLDYREPNTLEVAKKELEAQQIAAWKPAGAGKAAFGRTFYPASEKITLTGDSPHKDAFLHLVYRRLPENKSLTVVVSLGKEGTDVFDLDLQTPEYRVIDLPVQGARPQLSVIPTGPVEIAECALYSIQWPSPNLAYVKQSKSSSVELNVDGNLEDGDDDAKGKDALMKVLGEDDIAGKMKPCNIYVPNEDVDKITGAYVRSGVDALVMLDGKRFGNAKIPPWKPNGAFVGSWLTVDFGKGVPLGLVATYERAQKQSLVNSNIAVFSSDGAHEKVLNGIIGNDQFWRIFPVSGDVKILGVHIYAPANEGLSEVEAYQHLDK